MDFYFPASAGEWLAFLSAVVTILVGLTALFAPRLLLRLWRIPGDAVPLSALVILRGPVAGFMLGVGLCAVLFAQPFLYMALGAGWGVSVLGRIVSMLADRGFTAYNVLTAVVELLLAALALAYVFGYS